MPRLHRFLKFLICIVLLTTFLGCATTQTHESTGQYIDDAIITTKVKTAIFKEETLKSMQINVKTFKGIVQLSGFVDSANNITKAGEVAGEVGGVVSVKNNLIAK